MIDFPPFFKLSSTIVFETFSVDASLKSTEAPKTLERLILSELSLGVEGSKDVSSSKVPSLYTLAEKF